MKTLMYSFFCWRLRLGLLAFASVILPVLSARAGLHMEMHLYGGYFCYAWLSTNNTPPSLPDTGYFVWSPSSTINSGIHSQLNPDNTTSGSGSSYIPDFAAFTNEIASDTPWTLMVTNPTSTNYYFFTVSLPPDLSSNVFVPARITFPAYGQVNVPNMPTFTWTGPTNWLGTLYVEDDRVDENGDYYTVTNTYLPVDQTSWDYPATLPSGTNSFYMSYYSNATDEVIVSTPADSNFVALAGFTYQSILESSVSQDFVVASASSPSGHALKAYYTFEDNTLFTHDFSGNGNNISSYGGSLYVSSDAKVGSYAFGDAGNGTLYAPTNLLAALSGSFSVSVWLKTTQVSGSDTDDGLFGNAGVVSAFTGPGLNWVVPMSLTGGKLAFATGGSSQDTLHSLADINTGDYVHLVVTRDQATGEKRIYVNGALDNSDYASTDLLDTPTELDIGGNNGTSLDGVLDEIQIYSGVLSADEVQQLYENPGTTIPDVSSSGVLAHYDFDEGTELAADVSGNGNDLVAEGAFNGGAGPATNAAAIDGSGSVEFDGYSYLTAPANLLPSLAGSFSVSVWVKTSQDYVDSQSYNSDVNGIVAADIPGDANDLIPIGMDEYGEVVFNTGDAGNGDDEMYSWNYVNDGDWHHVVVTRDQTTGEKNIYIDGVLDDSSPEFGSTNLLNDPVLLTIGALSDASDPDPNSPDYNGDNGYEGLLDDLQIYPRVLSSNEVAYLYNHPGSNIVNVAKLPVDAEFHVSIVRNQTQSGGVEYYCFPGLDSVNVTETTQHTVESPNGWFTGSLNSSGSYIESSLGDVLNECTNGLWKLYINKGDLSEQVFTFHMIITGLDTNLLKPVLITSPANGSTNVPVSSAFNWSGPTAFDGIFAQTYRPDPPNNYVSTNLPGDATNWPSPPMLPTGTNRFYLSYHINNVPFITTTTPMDSSAMPVNSWSSMAYVNSDATVQFVVTDAASPVQLMNLQHTGNSIQFSFLTQLNHTNIIESRTNLTLGTWIPLTNIVGDGTTQQFSFPATNVPAQFFRVNTQ